MKTQEFRITTPGRYEYLLPFETVNEEGDLLGIIEARTKGDYEIRVVADHLVPGTKGRVRVKGVVENGAKVRLIGLVRIAEGAKNTDSFLSLKLLMLDNKSYAFAEPELDILNNEVKASHSASVGRIDKDQLFYLRSRGIDESESRKLIINGFLSTA